MRFNLILRKTHVYAGLQAGLGLLIFAVSAVVATFGEEGTWQVASSRYEDVLAEDDLEQARALHAAMGGRFEQVPERWMISAEEEGPLLVRFHSPNDTRELRLDRGTRVLEIRTKASGLGEFLNFMHQDSLGHRKLSDSPWLWAWSLYIEFAIAALFILPITGLYIWFTSRSRQRLAMASLALSCTTMLILWHWVR